MQKAVRPVAHKPVRPIVHKRRPRPSTRPPAAKPVLRPTITRVIGDVELVAPRGFCASVLLKLVTRDDGHRYYSWWAMAGRCDMDTFSARYKHNGEDVLRFDLPDGMALSAEALQPYLTSYLTGESTEPSDPPIIRG